MYFSRLGCLARVVKTGSEVMNRRWMSTLLNKDAFMSGRWSVAGRNNYFDVYNPANGSVVGMAPSMDVEDVKNAVGLAHKAFQSWSRTTAKERSIMLRKWFNVVQENAEHLAKILSLESGKPLLEAAGEITYGNSFIEWFSEEARRSYGDIMASPFHNKQIMHIKQPIGVTALITPWNFPMAMIARKAGAALAAGCTCVIKPAEDTPLSALALAYCAQIAGIPDGVINVVTVERVKAGSIGKYLCRSPLVAGITFTGSTAVGKLLYEQCAKGVKRLSLELGGNAPFIVFASSDLDKAVEGAISGKFRNCGQTCVSPNRFLIEDNIFDEFVSKLKASINVKLELGDPSVPVKGKQRLGPLINISQLKKVNNLVIDAVKKGAKVQYGGNNAMHLGELFYEPTLLTNITPDMLCYNEEIFGPVIPCIKFSSEDEALKIANSTNSGLAGYFYSKDQQQIWRVAKNLEVGMVGINESLLSTAEAAFGGVKESGIGREGSHYGMDEFVYIKYLCLGDL